MKSKLHPFVALIILATSAHGKIWDITPGDGSAITAGDGTWITGGANWNDGTTDSTWAPTGDAATFQAADDLGTYAVTVSGATTTPISTSGITFNHSGYTLSATAAQTITAGGITVASGKSGTVGSYVTVNRSTANLLISGGGTLNVIGTGAIVRTTGNSFGLNIIGSKVSVGTGGSLISNNSFVVGDNTNAAELEVNGGTVSLLAAGSSSNLVLTTSATTGSATITLTSGSITANRTDASMRFGSTSPNSCSGTFHLNGGTLTVPRIYEGNSGHSSTFNFNGGTLKVLSGTTNAANFMTGIDSANVKSGGAIIDTNGVSNVIIAQPLLDGGGGLTKQGSGTLTLTGANTYSGPTIINGGKLAITAPYSAITATTVNNTGRLKVNSSGTTPSSLSAVTLNAGSRMEFDLGTFDVLNQPALAIGTLTANANYAIDLTGTGIPVNTPITLLSYTNKVGTGVPSIGNLPPGVVLSGPPLDTGSSIQITVLPGFTWSRGDGDWDTTSNNWNANTATYAEPSVAIFPTLVDAGDGINLVNLTANRTPAAVTISNDGDHDSTAYAFAGPGGITGTAGITKTGSGIASFSNSTDAYTGPLAIDAGAVIKTVADNTTGNITVASNATIGLRGGITDGSGQTLTLSGPGQANADYFFAGSAGSRGSLQSIAGNNTWDGNISLAGIAGTSGTTTRIGVQNGCSLTLTGAISEAVAGMSPYFRAGNSPTDLIKLMGTCSWTGVTRIYGEGGAGVVIGGHNMLPTLSDLLLGTGGASTTNDEPTLDLAGFNQTISALHGTPNAKIKNSGASQSTLTLNPHTIERTYYGIIQGNVKLIIGGDIKQTLAGKNTHTGNTNVNIGASVTIASTGGLKFYPTTNGATNSVGGDGTIKFDGTLTVDISAANATPGNSWTLINASSLTTNFTATTFAVDSSAGAFAETVLDSGIWKLTDAGKVWTFTESNGKLTVATALADPYIAWIDFYFQGETNPAIIGKDADPDGDDSNNLAEFALNGNPNNGGDNGYRACTTEDTNANSQKELTLTIAVRKAAGSPVFSGSPLTSISDGVKYTIEGSLNLVFPTSAVSEATPATGPGGLPAAYEYRRFRLDASDGLPGKGFLRVKTEASP